MDLNALLTKLESIELSTTTIVGAVIALLVVSLLMAREFMTWLTKNNLVRKELWYLQDRLNEIEAKISALENKPSAQKSTAEVQFDFPIEPSAQDSTTVNTL